MTILLQCDWAKYPNAVVHTETRNASFLAISAQYREAGIQNHTFMLALHNPALRDIDPHDPTLTLDQQIMVVAEARDNMWYYYREIARNPLHSAAVPIQIEADRSNIAMWWAFGMHLMVGVLQIRETKKNFHANLLLSWLINSGMIDANLPITTKDEFTGKLQIAGIRAILDELPRYLDMRTPPPVTGDSPTELIVGILSNRLYVLSPQVSEKRAANQGRGQTFEVTVAYDLVEQYHAQISFPAMMPGMVAATARAKELNRPHGVIIPTCAGKRDTPEGEFVYRLFNGFARWRDTLFDCATPKHVAHWISKTSPRKAQAILIEMNHKDLGYSDEWLQERLESTRSKGDIADRDYFNVWTGKPVSFGQVE